MTALYAAGSAVAIAGAGMCGGRIRCLPARPAAPLVAAMRVPTTALAWPTPVGAGTAVRWRRTAVVAAALAILALLALPFDGTIERWFQRPRRSRSGCRWG
jgi:hypothetical protein